VGIGNWSIADFVNRKVFSAMFSRRSAYRTIKMERIAIVAWE
jgi:hypothetical protein